MLGRTVIFQINLDHRTDRWQDCLTNHQEMGYAGNIQRVPGILDEFGALGCARSHIQALAGAYRFGGFDHCLILEDDFDFNIDMQQLNGVINQTLHALPGLDVLMLSGSFVTSLKCNAPTAEKVFEAQSACAYLVRRRYIATLTSCFMAAADKLERYRHGKPREAFAGMFAIDIMWKSLQKTDDWYILNPIAGVQRPSYSDIEKTDVDHRPGFVL